MTTKTPIHQFVLYMSEEKSLSSYFASYSVPSMVSEMPQFLNDLTPISVFILLQDLFTQVQTSIVGFSTLPTAANSPQKTSSIGFIYLLKRCEKAANASTSSISTTTTKISTTTVKTHLGLMFRSRVLDPKFFEKWSVLYNGK